MKVVNGVTYYEDATEALKAGVPFVLHIPADAEHDVRGYVPSAVFERTAGHYPMLGSGEGATPWYFGTTLEGALGVCQSWNAKRGITEEQTSAIIKSSLVASLACDVL